MAAPAQTRIFGIKIGVDPKILVGGLIVFAGFIFWYNSRSDEDVPASAPVAHHEADPLNPVVTTPTAIRPKSPVSRRAKSNDADRGTLRLRAIDPTRGDVDPTLRLDLMAKVQAVQPVSGGRSLFEIGPAPLSAADQKLLDHPPAVPKVAPTPIAPAGPPMPPAEQPLNIPLKYYGFVKPGEKAEGNAGLFLDGDNVVVGTEGEVVMKKYLVVALTPATARLEDTQLKKSQTLNVVPAATP
jgi:hypothetical protein